jgi:hypothetical protein
VLGLDKQPLNNKASKGNIVHKALELLAQRKFCEQNDITTFNDELGIFSTTLLTPELALETAYAAESARTAKQYVWDIYDKRDCSKWLNAALAANNGMFNPLKRHVIEPERYFELEIVEPWAAYNYNGVDGYLGLKGTLDLITKVDDDTIELIDWKTGARKDWNTGEEKGYAKLCDDPQLHIYHYALRKVLPQYKNVIVTIFFIRDGGPFSLCFERNDMKTTEEMLRTRFQIIKNCVKPKLIWPDWKCTKLCAFANRNQPGTNKTVCKFFKEEIIKLGIDKVTDKYARELKYSGGGRQCKD